MNISLDMYLYIASLSNDIMTIRMLSVSKKYNKSEYFKRVFRMKYPHLSQFNKRPMGWINYYKRKIYYIIKLSKNDGIEYKMDDNYDPEYKYCWTTPKNIGGCPIGPRGPMGPIGPGPYGGYPKFLRYIGF